jgi:hypothetical protein
VAIPIEQRKTDEPQKQTEREDNKQVHGPGQRRQRTVLQQIGKCSCRYLHTADVDAILLGKNRVIAILMLGSQVFGQSHEYDFTFKSR